MRKDYMVAHGTAADETAFVEAYWTRVWDTIEDKAKRAANVEASEEYGVMRPYLDNLPRDARIVDGGCGLGEYVVYFHQRGFEALGVDLSEKTIAALNARFPEVRFAAGDIRALDLPPDSVDVYFSWGVFEHFEAGPGACIAEAHRVVKPGGLLFVTVPFDNARQSIRGVLERPRPPQGGARFYQWRFTRAELMRELSVAGFKVEKLRPISKREGLLRSLHFDFGMPFEWIATRALARVLHPLVPGGLIAHMLMAVARKPPGNHAEDVGDADQLGRSPTRGTSA